MSTVTYIWIGLLTLAFVFVAVRTAIAFWSLLPLEDQIHSNIYTAARRGAEQWQQGYYEPERYQYINRAKSFQKGFWACSILSALAIAWGCITTLAIWVSIANPDLGNALWGLLPPCAILTFYGGKLWRLQRSHKN